MRLVCKIEGEVKNQLQPEIDEINHNILQSGLKAKLMSKKKEFNLHKRSKSKMQHQALATVKPKMLSKNLSLPQISTIPELPRTHIARPPLKNMSTLKNYLVRKNQSVRNIAH